MPKIFRRLHFLPHFFENGQSLRTIMLQILSSLRTNFNSVNILNFIIIFFSFFLYRVHRYINKFFGDITSNEFLFFLQTPLKGADERLLMLFIHKCILLAFLYTILIFAVPFIGNLLLKFLKQITKSQFEKITEKKHLLKKIYLSVACFSAVLLAFYSLHQMKFIFKIYKQITSSYSTFYEEHFVMPHSENITFSEKKNLILLHVESMEKTFEDKSFFGTSLIPQLEQLKTSGIQFDSYIDGYGTNYTAGSLMAIFTGVPVQVLSAKFINYFGNRMNLNNKTLSLGKILNNNGYKSIALFGTDDEFAGQGTFLQINDVETLITKDSIQKMYPNTTQETWGYADEIVFKVAKETLSEKTLKAPYFMLIQTADTHTGYIHEHQKFHKFDNPYYNQIYSASYAIADFIRWLQKQPDYENTVIVIVGDHLRMGNNFAMPEERTIFNLFINAPKPKNIHRTFSQIDLFPSIIEAMGGNVKNHRLGLGVSVFSNEKTLAEQYTQKYLNEELVKRSKLSEEIWKP